MVLLNKKSVFWIICLMMFLFSIKIETIFANEGYYDYYLLNLNYSPNSEKIIQLQSIKLSKSNYTNDSGSGSQYYAKVSDNFNFLTIEDKANIYLGVWDNHIQKTIKTEDGLMESTVEETPSREIIVSIPYHPKAKKLNIYNAETDELALSVDVSRFAQNDEGKDEDVTIPRHNPQPEEPAVQDEPKEKSDLIKYLWIVPLGVAVLVVVGTVGYVVLRRRERS